MKRNAKTEMVTRANEFVSNCVKAVIAAQLPMYQAAEVVGYTTTAGLKQAASIAPCRFSLDYVPMGCKSPAAWDYENGRNRDYDGAIKLLTGKTGDVVIICQRMKGTPPVEPKNALQNRAAHLSTLGFHAFTLPKA